MIDLIPQCSGVLRLAETMQGASNAEMKATARTIVENNLNWAVEERGRWQTASAKLDEVIKAAGSSPQLLELKQVMDEASAAWDACAKEYDRFLSSPRAP